MGNICNNDDNTKQKTTLDFQQKRDIYLSNPKSQLAQFNKQLSHTNIGVILTEKTALILGCKKNQHLELLNKYMLSYLYFIRNKSINVQQEIEDFNKMLTYLDEKNQNQENIKNFKSGYIQASTPREKADYLIKKYFQNSFFSEAIQKFPTASYDPSILGYARRPLVDLFKGIKSKYDKQSKKKQIYSVIQTIQDQQHILNDMAQSQDYFTFSTFIRCFSSQQKAKKRQKNLQKLAKEAGLKSTTIFFNIQIPNQEIDRQYDHGFLIQPNQSQNESGDIIMNIMNFFQVTGYQKDTKTCDLKYNGLARLVHLKRARLLKFQPDLLKINTLIQAKLGEVVSHSYLLRVVKDNNLSITASQSLKSSNRTDETVEDNQRINLIEIYLQQRNYAKALQECKGGLQFKVRQAQIYYQNDKNDQVDKLLAEIQPQKSTLQKQHFTQYVIFELITAKRKIANGQVNPAKQRLSLLSDQMKKQYRGAYEFRGRQVQTLLLKCNNEQNKNNQEFERVGLGLNLGIMLSH